MDEVVVHARHLNLSPDDLARLAFLRARLFTSESAPVRLLFTECNAAEVDFFARTILEWTNVTPSTFLLEELRHRKKRVLRPVRPDRDDAPARRGAAEDRGAGSGSPRPPDAALLRGGCRSTDPAAARNTGGSRLRRQAHDREVRQRPARNRADAPRFWKVTLDDRRALAHAFRHADQIYVSRLVKALHREPWPVRRRCWIRDRSRHGGPSPPPAQHRGGGDRSRATRGEDRSRWASGSHPWEARIETCAGHEPPGPGPAVVRKSLRSSCSPIEPARSSNARDPSAHSATGAAFERRRSHAKVHAFVDSGMPLRPRRPGRLRGRQDGRRNRGRRPRSGGQSPARCDRYPVRRATHPEVPGADVGERGAFRFPNLKPGRYTITVSLPGFGEQQTSAAQSTSGGRRRPTYGSGWREPPKKSPYEPRPTWSTRRPPDVHELHLADAASIPVGRNREFVELMDSTAGINDRGGAYGTGGWSSPRRSTRSSRGAPPRAPTS